MMCVDLCERGAISVRRQSDGFRYPHIDYKKCTGCAICISRCPVNVANSMNNGLAISRAYVARARNQEIRNQSSSGGAFSVLAQQIVEENGFVAGVVADGLEVRHILTNKPHDLVRMRGSKYLQSNTVGIYRAVKKKLLEGKKVLFAGTPCQCMAIISFCGPRLRSRLIVVDLICHGVPSDRIIPLTEYGCGESITALLSWRSKLPDLKNTFVFRFVNREGETKALTGDQNCFIQLYISSLLFRNSCYRCPFAKIHHDTELTLADFHEKPIVTSADTGGVSLVLTHNKQGEQLLHRLSGLELEPYPIADALSRKFNSFTPNKLVYYHFARRLLRLFVIILPIPVQYFLYNQRQRQRNKFAVPLRIYEKILFILEERRIKSAKAKIFANAVRK